MNSWTGRTVVADGWAWYGCSLRSSPGSRFPGIEMLLILSF